MFFGGEIIGYLFFAGVGSGAFLFAVGVCIYDVRAVNPAPSPLMKTASLGFVVAPCACLVGIFLLVADLGATPRLLEVFARPLGSVMSAGACLLALFTVLAGLFALALVAKAWLSRRVKISIYAIGSLLALGVMSYTGILLSSGLAFDFWRSPWLVVLFVLSSLSTGTAATVACGILCGYFPRGFQEETCIRATWTLPGWLALGEFAVAVFYLAERFFFSDSARESCLMLLTGELAPLFWLGFVLCAFGVPFLAHVLQKKNEGMRSSGVLLTELSALLGGLFLRCVIVFAGTYASVFFDFVVR